jgi:hypothetical protein
MQEEFENYISELMDVEDSFIYKTNMELLRQFYNFILTTWNDEEMAREYLNRFESISDITSSKIEGLFSELVLLCEQEGLDYFNLSEFTKFDNQCGVYFIFNNINRLIYVGKSNNLSSRALQSFINKMPYGATSIKIWVTELENVTSLFEAVAIDYFNPIYNNKKEPFNLSYKKYTKIVKGIEQSIIDNDRIYPTNKEHVDRIKMLMEKRKLKEQSKQI